MSVDGPPACPGWRLMLKVENVLEGWKLWIDGLKRSNRISNKRRKSLLSCVSSLKRVLRTFRAAGCSRLWAGQPHWTFCARTHTQEHTWIKKTPINIKELMCRKREEEDEMCAHADMRESEKRSATTNSLFSLGIAHNCSLCATKLTLLKPLCE